MTSRRLYVVVCLLLPLFCLFFMVTVFGSGEMKQLPIAIVDHDDTQTSHNVARRIAAVPTFRVNKEYTDETAARTALQRKEIYGYLVIPAHFEAKSLRGEDATLVYYYHYALLSVGGQVMAAFENSLAGVSLLPIILQAEELGVSQAKMQTFLLPIEGDTHPLYNPWMNYSVYLSQPFFFVLLQILILLTTVYSIGSEIKMNTHHDWLDTAGGNILTAVVGKLLPYTIIYALIGIAANSTFFGFAEIPLEGSLWLMNTVTILFIIATQTLAVLLFALFPHMAYVISTASMIGSLGATLSGVTFPTRAMYDVVEKASLLFPVRHFTEALQGIVYYGSGIAEVWQQAVLLLFFPLVTLCILPRLKRFIDKTSAEQEAVGGTVCTPQKLSFRYVVRREWNNIAGRPSVLLVMAGGVFIYGLLYNYMYAPNVVRDTPVAVIDHSHTAISREYIRLLDATPQAAVILRTPYLQEARQLLKQGEVAGIVYLPHDFETRLSRGERSVFTLYATTDAFLEYKGLQEAVTGVMLAMNDAHRSEGLPFLPEQGVVAATYARPVSVIGTSLYNVTEGYGSYLIPAVLIVILFQTIQMVIASLRGAEAEKPSALQEKPSTLREKCSVFFGKCSVLCLLYAVFALFLIGLLPRLFEIPHRASVFSLLMLLTPFLLATYMLGTALSRWYRDSEAPILLIAYFSVGYIFLSGVSYPLELMPWYWQVVHYLFPVTPTLMAFVQLNSMGASWIDVWPQTALLWIQVLVYGTLAAKNTCFSGKKACFGML